MKKVLIIGTVIVGIVLVGVLFSKQLLQDNEDEQEKNIQTKEVSPINNISHVHALVVDHTDPSSVYLASHEGLLVLKNDNELYRIGSSVDDFMGFAQHPKERNIMYRSGHPPEGGNLGLEKSVDGGLKWEKVSDGLGGPVDYHTLAVSRANPSIIYGWYQGLQKSTDDGKSWAIVSSAPQNTLSLDTSPTDSNIVYVHNQFSILKSTDGGKTWKAISGGIEGKTITSFKVISDSNLIIYATGEGFYKSENGGENWELLSDFPNKALYISFDQSNPKTLYTATDSNNIFKSLDQGKTWEKIL